MLERRGKMIKYNAEGIGELEIENGVIGAKRGVEINMFHRQYTIDVLFYIERTDEGKIIPIKQPVIEAYHDFFKYINDRIKEAEDAILEYYRSEVKERFEEGYYEQYTEITNLEELVEQNKIVLKNVLFGFYNKRKKRVRYGLLFDCEWNIDDGLGIRYDGNIAEIGTSDVVL